MKLKTLFQLLLLTSVLTSTLYCQKMTALESKKSVTEAISILPNANVKEVIAYYHKIKKERPELYNFDDDSELNKLGYQYLNNGEVKDAIEVFKLLVAEFPDASNGYDSLGEAYFADGDKELAVLNYEKSLALNPKNINAEDWINKIKYAEYDDSKFYKTYTTNQYKADLNELGKRLTEVNPNVFEFITEDAFWTAIENKKEQITDETTFSEFIWICSEIIANINCSHTSMGYFYQERSMIPMELRFPLEIRLIDDKVYVSNALSNSENVALEDEITAINGIPFNDIQDEIFKHISSQGNIETYKKNFLNAHSTSIIPYALGFPKSYSIVVKGKVKPRKLKMLKEYENNFQELPEDLCQEPLCLKIIDNDKTAIMTLRSFAYYGGTFEEYQTFIDSCFGEFTDRGIKNLVIDVRGNGGGPSDAGIYLLRYLSDKPFKYFSKSQFNEKLDPFQPFENSFKGNLYFTIDGNGGSTTGHFMSLVKHLDLAIIVGEELGSNQFCTGGQKRLRLPNTGIQYAVSRNTYITSATSLPLDRGIMPDHFISQTIGDYLKNIDVVMNFTISLIDQNH